MTLAADSPLKFGWLEDGHFLERSGDVVVVEFPPSLEPQTHTLLWAQAVRKIEEQLSDKLGSRITLQCRFTGQEPPPPPPEPVAPPVPKPVAKAAAQAVQPASPAPPGTPAAAVISPEEMEAFKNDPLIIRALEIFKAEILITPQTT
jgi:hypothetical protein